MSSNAGLIDAATRHQIFVQRYAAGREQEAAEFIERLIREANRRLSEDVTELTQARLQSLIADLRLYSTGLFEEMSESVISEMRDFVEYEAGFTERMINNNVQATAAAPNVTQLQSAIFTSVMDLEPTQGYRISDALSVFGEKKAQQIVQAIRDGVAIGDTNEQIRRNVSDFERLQKNQSRSLVRTITNHVSVQARDLTLRENEELFDGYEWVATLDSRTSLICMSRDGEIYPFGDNPQTSPKPPAHFSCRSTIIPSVKPEFDLASDVTGKRPAKGAKGTTQVAADTTYESWLRRQPASFQDEILGAARGKLFRERRLDIGRFVDDQGRTLTLDELRQMEPLAFEGLDL